MARKHARTPCVQDASVVALRPLGSKVQSMLFYQLYVGSIGSIRSHDCKDIRGKRFWKHSQHEHEFPLPWKSSNQESACIPWISEANTDNSSCLLVTKNTVVSIQINHADKSITFKDPCRGKVVSQFTNCWVTWLPRWLHGRETSFGHSLQIKRAHLETMLLD